MPHFRYRAARQDGRTVSGVIDAETEPAAVATLVDRGLHPLAIAHAEPGDGDRRAASRADLAIVFRSIASLTTAGVPLERAVAATEPIARGELRAVLAEARTALHEGRSLAQALEAARGVVPGVVVGMVRAGERGSQLPRALEQVAQHLEQEAELVARVRTALAYPILLAVAGTASIVVIGTVVVPKFAEMLGELGQELPTATRLLLTGATFLSRHGIQLGVGIAALVVAAAQWIRRPGGRLRWHGMLLALPVIGSIRHALATARLARALGGMLAAGMPLLPALAAASDAAGDAAVSARVRRAAIAVSEGRPLAASLVQEAALAPQALQLLAVGEASSELGAMATRAGELAARQAERALQSAVALLEPALVVLFGGVVAFVAAALLQAVYSVRPGV